MAADQESFKTVGNKKMKVLAKGNVLYSIMYIIHCTVETLLNVLDMCA